MNPFNAPPSTEYTFLSLGAGVQSTRLALDKELHQKLGIKIDAAIFADTHAEPKSVYRHLDKLEAAMDFPLYRVNNGNLTEDSLLLRKRNNPRQSVRTQDKPVDTIDLPLDLPPSYTRALDRFGPETGFTIRTIVPFYIKQRDGKIGSVNRNCTLDFKVYPINKKQKELAGVVRGQKHVTVTSLIGISIDEHIRAKPSREKWCQHRYPFLEEEISRQDCINWLHSKGWGSTPRSACTYCPYHNDAEWVRLRDKEPEDFAAAVQFERDLQAQAEKADNLLGAPYLHSSCIPLDQVDFKEDDPNQLSLFGNECEGMCGV
jgi:hypothetical protein